MRTNRNPILLVSKIAVIPSRLFLTAVLGVTINFAQANEVQPVPMQQSPSEVSSFGEPMPTGPSITLSHALGNRTQQEGKAIKISGTVAKVCKKKGCWMILTDGDNHARVTFKDYGFFVPKSIQQRKATVYGVLQEKQLSKRMVKHYLEDEKSVEGGKSFVGNISARKEYTIVAESVVLAELN